MNDSLYPILAIAIISAITFALRAFPFLLFSGRPLPKMMEYLGEALPPAIMTILVIYCLRNVSFASHPYGIPELLSGVLVILLQAKKKNMYLSIVAGTVCYMILIRII